MKVLAKITAAFLVFICTVGVSLARPILIVGPTSYGQGGTATYTYDAGVLIPSLYWQGTNVTLGTSGVNGTQYWVTVTWSSTATSGTIAVWGNGDPGTQLSSLTVSLVSCNGTLPPTSIVQGSRCGPGAVTLSAAAPTSDYYVQWYDANMWGILSTGAQGATSTYTTPSISSTTNYKVTAVFASTGCQSAPTTVPATIYTVPTITTSTGSQTICNGNSANIVFTNNIANTTNSWTVVPSGVNGATNGSGTSGSSSPYQYTFAPTLTTSGSSQGTATYTVTPSANGCPGSTASVTITVSPSPGAPPPITPPAAICAGLATSITATPGSGGTNINWYSTASGGSPLQPGTTFTTPTLYGNTNYYAETFNGSGCPSASRTAVTVTVNAVPAAPVSGTDGSACYMVDQAGTGNVSAVPGSGANTIRWYTGGNQLTPDGLSYQGSTSSSTKYNAYSYNSTTGCQSATSIIVWLIGNPTPNQPTFTGGDVRCGPGQFNLTATVGSNGDQVKWYDNNHSYKQTGTTYSPIISVSGTMVYATTYNSSTQCESGQKGESVLINPLPSPPTIMTPNPMCVSASGTGTINTAAPPTGYGINWYSSSTGGTSFTYGTTYTTPIISTPVTYYLEMVTSVGCISATRTAVSVNPEPVPNSLSSTLVCGTGTSVITGSPGTGTALKLYDGTLSSSYLYTPSPVTSYTTGNISSNQTYYAASYNSSTGCESQPSHRVAVGVTERPMPTVGSSGDQTFCGAATTSIILTNNLASTVNNWTLSATNVSGASPGSGTSGPSSPYTYTIGQSLTPTGTVPGVATYTVTPSLNGCTGLPITVKAIVNPKPTITVSNNNPAFCSGGSTSIGITNTNGISGVTYSWSLSSQSSNLAGASAVTNTSSNSISQVLSATTTYGTVAYSITASANNCSSTALPANVTVTPKPSVTISGNQTICNSTGSSITLTNDVAGTTNNWTVTSVTNVTGASNGSGVSGSTAPFTYLLAQPLTTANSAMTGSVSYLVAPVFGGCPGTPMPVTMTVNWSPDPPVPAGDQFVFANDNFPYLEVIVPDGMQAKWHVDPKPMTPAFCTTPGYQSTVLNPTYYVSLMYLANGCESSRAAITNTTGTFVHMQSVSQETIRIPGKASDTDVDQLSSPQKAKTISFIDGLGRTSQVIAANATPSNNDIVQPYEYDSYGRTSKDYLPYAVNAAGTFQETYHADIAQFYLASGDKIADDYYPFSLTNYEQSTLGRPLVVGSVGQEWQPGVHAKTVKYTYNNGATNDEAEEVRKFAVGGTSFTSFRRANTLSRTAVNDENGNTTITFVDGSGLTVARKQQLNGTINGTTVNYLQTYYIYDSLKRLQYIIPPGGIAALKGKSWMLDTTIANQHLHQFIYDSLGRVVQKKTPGQAWSYFVYDPLGRLVLSQDGNQRAQNKWVFVKYDIQGRPVSSGFYKNTTQTTLHAMQGAVNSWFAANTTYYESRSSSTAPILGYSNVAFPVTNSDLTALELYSVQYYDNYNFDGTGGDDYTYNANHIQPYTTFVPPYNTAQGQVITLPAQSTQFLRGKATGGRKLIIGTSTWLKSAVFYDSYGRVIQSQSDNHLGGTDVTSVTYDFEGKTIQTLTTHIGNGTTTSVLQTPIYDNQGRVSQIKHSINGAADQIVAQYQYNELGQVVMKQLHNTGGSSYMQNVDYRYNIKGWLGSINNAQLANDANVTNGDTNDFFGMELLYNTVQTGLNDQVNDNVYYNGNVSAVKWKSFGAATGVGDQRSYKFAYDKTDKLLTAVFQKSVTATNWGAEAGTRNELMSYDHNGNILTLTRTQNLHTLSGTTVTSTAQIIDNLTYSYADPNYSNATGNRLMSVSDASLTTGFADGNTTGQDYVYDKHGNATKDLNKGITAITYNLLGKAQQITFSDGRVVGYTYDAGGAKLKMTTTVSGTTTTTDYSNGFVYTNSALSFFSSPEGRVVKNGSSYEYQYAIADHQGNTRVLFTSAAQAPVPTLADFDGDANDQSTQFTNVPAPVSYAAANHTPGGSNVARMNQSNPVGPSISKKVYPGDKVDMEVYSYHEATSGYGTTNVSNLATLVASAFVTSTGGVDLGGAKTSGVNSVFANLGAGANMGDTQPAAYLNYILFDQNYGVLDAGWQVVPAASFSQQKVSIPTVTVKEPGYIFVYLSYEDQSNNYVYFDDFKVTVTPTAVVQGNDYYPFGLQHATSWTRDNTVGNNFLYDGGNELNINTSIYHTPFRGYDPALGRFMQIDLLAHIDDNLTPYHYAGNNPIGNNDPLGLMKEFTPKTRDEWNVYWQYVASGYQGSIFDWADDGASGGSGNGGAGASAAMVVNLNAVINKSMSAMDFAGKFGLSDLMGALQNGYEVNIGYNNAGKASYSTWIITGSETQVQDRDGSMLQGWDIEAIWKTYLISESDETDLHHYSQLARKISGGLLSLSLPLQQGFERASLYGAPPKWMTTNIRLDKAVLGKKVVGQPLFEMNAIKAGKWANGLKIAGKIVGAAGVGLALYDVSENGLTTSNSLDLAMSALALSGFGTSIAAGYFILNTASILITGNDIGQHIDNIVH